MTIRASFWTKSFSFFLCTACLSGAVSAARILELSADAKKSIVFLTNTYWDPTKQEVVEGDEGSGVIVSKDGDIITAYHVIKAWLSQDPDNRRAHPLIARVGGRDQESKFVEYIAGDSDSDIAILRLKEHKIYAFAPICYNLELGTGQELETYGFPDRQDFTAVRTSFSNPNGDQGRYSVVSSSSQGLSGGPVYDIVTGTVIGLNDAGVVDSNSTSFVTPIKWLKPLLESRTFVKQDCAAHNGEVQPDNELFDVTVTPTPDTIQMAAGTFMPVDFEFTQNSSVDLRLESQDSEIVTPGGDVLSPNFLGGRILGGSFIIKAGTKGVLHDNIYLPPDVVVKAHQLSSQKIQLRQTYHLKDANGHEQTVPAILQVVVQ